MFLFNGEKYKLSSCSQRFFATLGADLELAISSRKKYQEIMKRIIDEMGDIDIRSIDLAKVTALKNALNQKNLSASRKNHYLVVLRLLLKFVKETDGVEAFDYMLIKKFKEDRKAVEFLTDDEVAVLLQSIGENSLTKLRLKTLIICLLSTGARISEIMSLDRKDIDFEKGLATTRGKGNKINQVIFNDISLEYLGKYLSKRTDECPALFATSTTKTPRRWQVNCSERAIRNQARRAGITKRVYPHIFRKTAASKMFFAGAPIPIVAKFLSHSNLSTCQKYYLRGADFEEVKDYHKDIMKDFGRDRIEKKGGSVEQ